MSLHRHIKSAFSSLLSAGVAPLPPPERDRGPFQDDFDAASGQFPRVCVSTTPRRLKASALAKTCTSNGETTLVWWEASFSVAASVPRSSSCRRQVHRTVYMIGLDRFRPEKFRPLASFGGSEFLEFTRLVRTLSLKQFFVSFNNFSGYYFGPQTRLIRSQSFFIELFSRFINWAKRANTLTASNILRPVSPIVVTDQTNRSRI